MRLLSLLLVGVTTLISALAQQPESYQLPYIVDGPVDIGTSPANGALDRAYIYPHNASTYEWWYFDAIAADHSSSIVVVVLALPPPIYIGLVFQIIWPNGTVTDLEKIYADTTKFNVATQGNGSSAALANGDVQWAGKPDLSRYDLKVDLPEYGVKGTIQLNSIASSYVAGSSITADATSQIWWYFNWLDVVPDAVATVNFQVGDDKLAFTGGVGYHDKNWGASPYQLHIGQWYWGHGRAGDYSVVWAYMLDGASGIVKGLGHVSKGREVLYVGHAADDSITVLPYGNVSFPLSSGDSNGVAGFEITFNGQYAFTFEQTKYALSPSDLYARWIGTLTGGEVGGSNVTGPGVMELMGPFPRA